jgi:hypothetical protein
VDNARITVFHGMFLRLLLAPNAIIKRIIIPMQPLRIDVGDIPLEGINSMWFNSNK